MCVGVITAFFLHHSSVILVSSLVSALLILFVGRFLFEDTRRVKFLAFLLGLLAVGVLLGQFALLNEKAVRDFTSGDIVTVRVDDRYEKNASMLYQVTTDDLGERYLLRTVRYPIFQPGDLIRVTTSGKRRESLISTTSEVFSYELYLQRQGYSGLIEYPREISLLGKSETLLTKLHSVRLSFEERLKSFVLEPQASLALSTLFGASGLSGEEKTLMRDAGLSHITALSGFNITILMVFCFYIFKHLPFYVRLVAGVLLVALFLGMVPQSGSLFRATIMSGVTLGALFLGRVSDARSVLSVSVFIVAVTSPRTLVYDASFHLSVLALIGMLFIAARFDLLNRHNVTIKNVLGALFVTSFSAALLTGFYTLVLFDSFSFYGVFLNSIIVPLVPLLMATTSAVILFSYFSQTLALSISLLVDFISSIIFLLAKTSLALPFADVSPGVSFLFFLFVGGVTVFTLSKPKPVFKVLSKDSNHLTAVATYTD